ncbi:hypothetical protein RB653_000138 [Dictyostelium firmibasis]|uniref:AAA+ ATPase domain-containing protein n=1 Tax=Dictyostelium firmibasis TaxID=79012 RepID=A0AAN7U6N3_9MYCE
MDIESATNIIPNNEIISGGSGGGMNIGFLGMLFGAPFLSGGNGSSTNSGNSIANNQYDMIKFGLTILFVTWVVTLIKSYLISIVELIKNRFYFTAHLTYPDSMFVYFLEWLSSKQDSTIVGTRGVSVMTRYQNVESDDGQMDIKLLPTGTQWLWYNGYLISIVRITATKRSFDGIKDDSLDVTVYGGNKKVISSMLETAVEYSVTLNKDKTKIYSLDQSATFWECIACQNKRLVDSVFLDENVSEKVVNDLSNFIHGKKWYTDTGVPYRRGYLLYGPPGSGKTSFILSMAGNFGKSISIMNMSKGIHDGNIHSIIQKCNKDTILVLEDIDAVFVKRKNNSGNDVLTFSALLNAIDGLASSDGRILMMTTNHLDRLSPALIRPGRIDLKVKFDYASHHQIELMFKRFFDQNYHHLIDSIVSKLDGHLISTAQLQGWFIIHRDSPLNLLPTCQDFIDQCTSETKSNDLITKDMIDENNNDDIGSDDTDDDKAVNDNYYEGNEKLNRKNSNNSKSKKIQKDDIKTSSILLSSLSPSKISQDSDENEKNYCDNDMDNNIGKNSSITRKRKV